MNLTTRRINLKNAAVAVVASSALVLAACGSDEDTANNDTTAADTTTTATSTSTATSTATSEAETSEEDTTSREAAAAAEGEENVDEPAQDEQAPADDQAAGEEFDPNNPEAYLPIENADLAPVEGGQPASDEDAAAITALLNNINNETTLRGYLGYIPNNACTRVINEAGGPAALDLSQIPDVPLNAYPDFANAKATIDSVDDIVVNGDEASALVTATTADGTTTETQRFLRENGTWTFCN